MQYVINTFVTQSLNNRPRLSLSLEKLASSTSPQSPPPDLYAGQRF